MKFHEIFPVVIALILADGQREMTKLIIAFRNCVRIAKNSLIPFIFVLLYVTVFIHN
jgi:hypothetical protein